MYATSDKSIGKVLTTLTVTNRADQSAATRGFIPTEQIRSITLDNVLVEQGATTLSLPEGAIAIPSKTKQPIAIGLSFSFLTKGDLSPQLNIGPIALLVTNVFAGKRDRPTIYQTPNLRSPLWNKSKRAIALFVTSIFVAKDDRHSIEN